jgi:hypothetical protein
VKVLVPLYDTVPDGVCDSVSVYVYVFVPE